MLDYFSFYEVNEAAAEAGLAAGPIFFWIGVLIYLLTPDYFLWESILSRDTSGFLREIDFMVIGLLISFVGVLLTCPLYVAMNENVDGPVFAKFYWSIVVLCLMSIASPIWIGFISIVAYIGVLAFIVVSPVFIIIGLSALLETISNMK